MGQRSGVLLREVAAFQRCQGTSYVVINNINSLYDIAPI